MFACDIDAALSIIPSSENEIRLLTALRAAETTTRRLEAHSYQLQTTNIKNEQRIHHLEIELVGLRQLYDQREELHAQREREWAQEAASRKEEDKRRESSEGERKEMERNGDVLTSERLGDTARKRKRYHKEEKEKQEKSQVPQIGKAPQTKQQVKKEQGDEMEDGTKKESKDAKPQVLVKKEPMDEHPKDEKKVVLSCNTLYDMARKREVYLREEEARKKRNQEEAHDLWEKAVVSWEKEKEQTRKDIQAARAYNKQAEDDHQMLSIRVRLKLINGEVPPLVLRPIPKIPTKPALYDFLAAAAAKKD